MADEQSPGGQPLGLERLQDYLRWSASQHRVPVETPSFTAFFSPHDERRYFNYAVPNQSLRANLEGELIALGTEFLARGRRPSFEFLEAYAPELADALQRVGFVETSRETVMFCRSEQLRSPPPHPDLDIVTLDESSPSELLRICISTTERGFDPERLVIPTRSDVEEFRSKLVTARSFLALRNGAPAGVAMYTAPNDGLAEIAGVATVPEHRRNGVGSAVTARAARAAFSAGVDTVFLAVIEEDAARVYRRLGFTPLAAKLGYGEPEPTEEAWVATG